ncbi:AraC family transcriptional regulator [Amycolatopsis sp. YIM 10]|uniref:helix-turn-helix domain-containing protein n=1 Tax=Amycolatopsis sp. YIM 10 TaxID=2653857 RepID=UPI0012905C04|nr:helix-turn-helix domain-containing protein [Amycolatopsis sp. YIM 10]QFU92689.1 Helix-turn-helix domain protein [Amycolatopsis sp. YIM 10]
MPSTGELLYPQRAWDEAAWRLPDGAATGIRAYRGFRFDQRSLRADRPVPSPRVSVVLLCGGPGEGIEVALEPWAAYTLFGSPRNDRLPVPWLRAATGELRGIGEWRRRFVLLHSILRRRLAAGPPSAPAVRRAWHTLADTGGTVSMTCLARAAGSSERQLERRFRQQIGIPPKVAARLFRFRTALRLLSEGKAAAEVAAFCGFCDQGHLSREFTAMTGLSICRFFTRRRDSRPPLRIGADGRADGLVVPAGHGMAAFSKTDATGIEQSVPRAGENTSPGRSE